MKKGTIVPIVFGALIAISDLFDKYAGKLNVTIRLGVIQKATLLETADYYGTFWLFRDSNVETCCYLLPRIIYQAM